MRFASPQLTAAIVAAAALIASTALSATAAASDKLLLGGGAGIALNGDRLCTLTAIGYDSADRLIGFTAAQCGGVGSPVVADGAEDEGVVGTVVAADGDLGYAVIEFDQAKAAGIRNYEGFAIKAIDTDPEHLQQGCKLGRATGVNCWDAESGAVDAEGNEWWQPGDDGAPVTVDDLIVGMVRDGSVPVAPLAQPGSGIVLFSAIVDDVNAKGGPGAGFTLAT
ncbi:S1 family peptidase [[Mycobacterium] nativiensis]|uniref:S1 family peptidase n=1 Tax=[Mycobacterium] nativiensis TaxID=2855503 RepID=A0ABU5XVA0_9MYCO|nr:S1 family peptidase [Mycolicibacter sp. MYC340]MEB3031909.1 S1 family peptidase [Mycolicibacter sp. MYC340]